MGWASEMQRIHGWRNYVCNWREVLDETAIPPLPEWEVIVGHNVMSHKELCDWCKERGNYPVDYILQKNGNHHYTVAVFKDPKIAFEFKMQFVGGGKYRDF